jgi:hypothetical protein
MTMPYVGYRRCPFTCLVEVFLTKGGRFEIASDIRRELQAVCRNIKENDLCCAFEPWIKMLGSFYTFPRGLFGRRLQPNLSPLSQHCFVYR